MVEGNPEATEEKVRFRFPNRRNQPAIPELLAHCHETKPMFQPPISVNRELTSHPPPVTLNGAVTPQGWVLLQLAPFPDEVRLLSQDQADEATAQLLGLPRAFAVLFRHLTNIEPGAKLTREEVITKALQEPQYFLGTQEARLLIELARRVDQMSAEDWNTAEQRLAIMHSSDRITSLLGAPISVHLRPLEYELTDLVQDAFYRAASLASAAAYAQSPIANETTPFIRRDDILVAAGRAAVEILHGMQLASAGHQFPYITLFGIQRESTRVFRVVDPRHPNRPIQETTAQELIAARSQKPSVPTLLEENTKITKAPAEASVPKVPARPYPPTRYRRRTLTALIAVVGAAKTVEHATRFPWTSATENKLDTDKRILQYKINKEHDELRGLRSPELRRPIEEKIKLYEQDRAATEAELQDLQQQRKSSPGAIEHGDGMARWFLVATVGASAYYYLDRIAEALVKHRMQFIRWSKRLLKPKTNSPLGKKVEKVLPDL